MKILIVAGYFPPYAPASASRVNKLAKYLDDQGHDVRVLGPENTDLPPVIIPEISADKIIYSDYSSINDFPGRVKNKLKSLFASKTGCEPEDVVVPEEPVSSSSSEQESFISKFYRSITNIPDTMIGWYPPAIKAGRKLFMSWSPDIIFCTVPPHTGLLVAGRLSRMIDVPWVADYRDLWTDHGYYKAPFLREKIDRFLESRALSNCKGLITVTRSWAEHLKTIHDLPIECVMNGYDPADFALETKPYDSQKLTILYAGVLYGRKRDPSALFEAMGRMGAARKNIRVLLYTSNGQGDIDEEQQALIEKFDLQDNIEFNHYIPQKELLEIQAGMDVLMLLRWNDPREDAVIAGKLFEYIGAGKTILSVGSTTGEAADIIRDNDFGVVSNDPAEIADFLKAKLAEKAQGQVGTVNSNREKFNRQFQFAKLELFLEKVAKREA